MFDFRDWLPAPVLSYYAMTSINYLESQTSLTKGKKDAQVKVSKVKVGWGLFGSAVLLARAHFPEQRLVIDSKISVVCNSYKASQDWLREQ